MLILHNFPTNKKYDKRLICIKPALKHLVNYNCFSFVYWFKNQKDEESDAQKNTPTVQKNEINNNPAKKTAPYVIALLTNILNRSTVYNIFAS